MNTIKVRPGSPLKLYGNESPAPTCSQLIEADERLAIMVSHFYWVQQAPDALTLPQQLLPTYGMLLAFNFGSAISMQVGERVIRVHTTVLLGPLRSLLRYELAPGADLLVVNFTLNGFYQLLGRPRHKFQTAAWQATAAVLHPQVFEALWQELTCLTTLSERLQRISAYLLTQLKTGGKSTHPLIDSVPLFHQTVIDPVKAIAAVRGVSARSIQLCCQTNWGYSAKELTRFLRFKGVLEHLIDQAAQVIDWSGIVERFGYYDQSHLIRDFRYFLDMTPSRFLEQARQGAVCMSQAG